MAPIRLVQLWLRSFGPFVEEQQFKLPQSGIHLIRGENLDTDGSSGSGKTRLVEALAFIFGYSTFSATDLQSWSWLTKEPLRAGADFLNRHGERIRVRRGKPANIQVSENGEVQTSAKAVTEVLRAQTGGLSPDMLKALTYRPQKEPGLFLAMTDQEKKKFLTELLGLGKYERIIETSVQNVTGLEKVLVAKTAVYAAAVQNVPPEPQAPYVADLLANIEAEKAIEADHSDRVDVYKKLYDDVRVRVNAAIVATSAEWDPKVKAALAVVTNWPAPDLRDIKASLDQANAAINRAADAHRVELQLRRQELRAQEDLTRGLKAIADKEPEIQKLIAESAAKLQKLEAQTCYTCKRPWTTDSQMRAEALTLQDKLRALEESYKQAKDAARQMPMMNAARQDLNKVVLDLDAKNPINPELREVQQGFAKALAVADAEARSGLAEAKAEYEKVRRQSHEASNNAQVVTPEEEALMNKMHETQLLAEQSRGRRQAASAKLSALQSGYTQACAEWSRQSRIAADARHAMEGTEKSLHQEQDFQGYVRGFLSLIFDETLTRVAALTNERLALIPNVSNLVIRFDSERETQTGKLRQEIRPVVEKDGNIIPLKAGVSGGMYTAVELAVDLSLADVISERTGVVPGWLILDESFEGLDTVCKAACFDMLKAAATDRAIFVIDHTTEFKEKFDSTITVRTSAGRATVVL